MLLMSQSLPALLPLTFPKHPTHTLSCQVWSYGFTTSPTGQPELDSQLSGSSSTNGSSGGGWQQQWGQQVLVPGLSPAQRECKLGRLREEPLLKHQRVFTPEGLAGGPVGLACTCWPIKHSHLVPTSTVTPVSSKPPLEANPPRVMSTCQCIASNSSNRT
jgi:hypothetical protein